MQMFSKSSLDFVDCILIARHQILGDEVVSFDKKLRPFQVLCKLKKLI